MKKIFIVSLFLLFFIGCTDNRDNPNRVLRYDKEYKSLFGGTIINDNYFDYPSTPPLVVDKNELIIYSDKTCTAVAKK